MATSFSSGSVGVSVSAAKFNEGNAIAGTTPRATDTITMGGSVSLAAGTGEGQMQQFSHDAITVSGSSTTTLALADGSLTNLSGEATAYSAVKIIRFTNESTTASESVLIGKGATNGMTRPWFTEGALEIKGGGGCIFIATDESGYSLTGSTDEIDIQNANAEDVEVTYVFGGEE